MNKFLEEKEKLLNSIENNTPKHWKEYYKDVPLDCIFDDLVIDINEIKRLTKENQQLKGSLQTYEILLKANVEENKELKKQLENCYCNRTDCSSRIKDSKKYDSLAQKAEKQQKEFIEWLEKESKEVIRDAGYHQRICEDILEKYKEIVGSDK